MSAPTPTPFEVTGPLPGPGTTLLEASAGTGKTWTIGALVTRYVAEGVAPLDRLLVVTFGRAASQELRERVRAQLVEAERALAGEHVRASDLLDLLLACDPDERVRRRRRVAEALAGFDAATIATTHQFCSLVLGSLGVAGDTNTGARLVEDLDDLVDEVVDDLYLRAFAYADGEPEIPLAVARSIARTAVNDPQARLEPAVTAGLPPAVARRVAFAGAVRAELDRRKRRLGLLSYDDLLSQLADALADEHGPAAARMRQRWSIVLVDEFQDTDPVQWQVLHRAFGGHATMVLIGDPKQAIYAFRGGDVATYLQAAATATHQHTLGVNWRSDEPLLRSFQALLRGAALGDDRIVVHDVDAHHQGSRLQGVPRAAPFRLRVVRRDQLGRRGTRPLTVGEVRPHVAGDLARDVKALLASGATFDGRPLEPRHVAVIAYRHADLAAAQEALHAVGVPAVIAGGGSVFATPAAVEWLELLEALEQPHRTDRVRAAALTCFFGLTPEALDAGGDRLTDEVADTLRGWAEVFALRGVAAVLEAAYSEGLPERVLAQVGGERRLTDLRHIGEVLHEAAIQERLGLVAMLTWLRGQVAEGRAGRGAERTRRLDSDAAAVQLVTIHASKGLQYPVVYLPSLADRNVPKPSTPLFHDDEGVRCVDVGGAGPDWHDHCRRWAHEEAGEWLRLLYVAVTRAQSQVVAWWAPTRNTPASPLHRMTQGRRPGQAEVPDEFDNRSDDDAAAIFARWAEAGGPAPEPAVWSEPPAEPLPDHVGELSVRRFRRSVDVTWRRTSYSALTAVEVPTPLDAVGSEPETTPKDDEELPAVMAPDADTPVADTPAADTPGVPDAASVPSPMAGLPVGATFGSLVHGVLEHTDPDAPDLRAEVLGHIDEQLVRWPALRDIPSSAAAGRVSDQREELADAVVAVLRSPLGPLAEGLTLCDIPLRDRLAELEFELPLAGGDLDRQLPEATLGLMAPLLRRHLRPGDPVRAWADTLDEPALGGQALRGYLTGSVDVVLRVHTTGGPRYLVVDYKTNWLGGPAEPGSPLTAHDYRPEALAAAMGHSSYPLQALLYAVVLHRFLRWRQPGYDPATHLGGVLYLYLRGMCGPDTPVVDGQPCGVFGWRPPVALVEELSDLLDGAVETAGGRR